MRVGVCENTKLPKSQFDARQKLIARKEVGGENGTRVATCEKNRVDNLQKHVSIKRGLLNEAVR